MRFLLTIIVLLSMNSPALAQVSCLHLVASNNRVARVLTPAMTQRLESARKNGDMADELRAIRGGIVRGALDGYSSIQVQTPSLSFYARVKKEGDMLVVSIPEIRIGVARVGAVAYGHGSKRLSVRFALVTAQIFSAIREGVERDASIQQVRVDAVDVMNTGLNQMLEEFGFVKQRTTQRKSWLGKPRGSLFTDWRLELRRADFPG